MSNLLSRVGPGLMLAATAVGVSHLVYSTQAGGHYGFSLVALTVPALPTFLPKPWRRRKLARARRVGAITEPSADPVPSKVQVLSELMSATCLENSE